MRTGGRQPVLGEAKLRVSWVEGERLLEKLPDLLACPLAIHPIENARLEHHGLRLGGLDGQHAVQARDRGLKFLRDLRRVPVSGSVLLPQGPDLVSPEILRHAMTADPIGEMDLLIEIPHLVAVGEAGLPFLDRRLRRLEFLCLQGSLGLCEDANRVSIRHGRIKRAIAYNPITGTISSRGSYPLSDAFPENREGEESQTHQDHRPAGRPSQQKGEEDS